MKNTKTFEEKYQDKLTQYASVFNLDDLNDANDRSLLETMIKGEIMTDGLQEKIAELMEEPADNVTALKKLHDLLKDATAKVLEIQRALNIDRKTRKSEETTSVADYLRTLRRAAKEFMDQRIIPAYCPNCKVMVGRIYPVHDHTAFSVSFQCSQCQKMIRARRDERDVLFDVRDHQWRRKKETRAEIMQAKNKTKTYTESDQIDDELYLGDSSEILLEDRAVLEEVVIQDEAELNTYETTN